MPRQILLADAHDRSRSLGWLATSWVEHFVRHGPGGVQGLPVAHGEEYTQFIVDSYAVGDAPTNNHMLYDSVFLSRPKGTDKSGLAARFCLFEAFGPCRFTGEWAQGGEVYEDPWDMGFRYEYQPGEPMGRPVRAPYIRIMATEEGQSGNTYRTVLFNLTSDECPLYYVPAHDTGREKVLLRGGGEIRTSTASSSSKDGGLETFGPAPCCLVRRGAGPKVPIRSIRRNPSIRHPRVEGDEIDRQPQLAEAEKGRHVVFGDDHDVRSRRRVGGRGNLQRGRKHPVRP